MDRQTLLKGIYLFGDATDADLTSLLEIATPRKYRQGELIFDEGDEADAMFVVEMGTADMVPTGKELAIVTIGSGQALGEVALFQARQIRPGSARAREASTILRIPFGRLERIARRTARFRAELLSKRVRIFGQAPSDTDNRGGPALFLDDRGNSGFIAVVLLFYRFRFDHQAPKSFDCD